MGTDVARPWENVGRNEAGEGGRAPWPPAGALWEAVTLPDVLTAPQSPQSTQAPYRKLLSSGTAGELDKPSRTTCTGMAGLWYALWCGCHFHLQHPGQAWLISHRSSC